MVNTEHVGHEQIAYPQNILFQGLRCQVCQCEFATFVKLARHLRIHSKDSIVLSCPCCRKNSLSQRYWREHISKNHSHYIRQTSENSHPRNFPSLPSSSKSTAPESPQAFACAESEQPESQRDNLCATGSGASDPVTACAPDSELDYTGVSDSSASNSFPNSSPASTVNFPEFFETLVTEHGVSGRACQEVAAFVRKACKQSATEARDNLESDICGLPSVVTASSYTSLRRIASGSGSTLAYIIPHGAGKIFFMTEVRAAFSARADRRGRKIQARTEVMKNISGPSVV